MARLLLGNKFAHAAKDRPWLHRSIWWIEAALIGAALRVLGWLPVDRASALGRRCMGALGPRLAKHRKVKENLRLVFPSRPAEEIERLAVGMWGNVGAAMAEYGHLAEICGDGAGDRLEIECRGDIRAFGDDAAQAVFVTPHLSNFEVCSAAIRHRAGPLAVVYKPLKNPRLNTRLARFRKSLGCELVSSDAGSRPLIREVRAGRSIGIVMDQRHEMGTPIPMFGIPKRTTLVPARLALRHGLELVPVRTRRLTGSRFRVTFYEPVPHGDPALSETERAIQMTTRVNALFEDWIRECPEDWLPMRLVKSGDVPENRSSDR
jgi:Kdo2-lipid IVA lauroyltransferase/acyltransferase